MKRGPLKPVRAKRPAKAPKGLSLRDLTEALERASVGLVCLSGEGRVVSASGIVADITGYSGEELISLRFEDLVHPEDRSGVHGQMEQLLAGVGQTATWEQRVARKDGFAVWVEITLSASQTGGRLGNRILATIEDITGRKRVEDGLRFFRTAVESLPLGVTIANLDGSIDYLNPAEARMHGYAVEELLGREAKVLSPSQQTNVLSLREQLDRGLVSDAPFVRETENMRSDGSRFPVAISSVLVRDMRGTLLGVVSVAEDITERRRMLDALRESERKYRRLVDNSLIGVFRSTVDGKVLYVNDAHARMAGFASTEEMMAVPTTALYRNPTDWERMLVLLKRDGQVTNFEFEHARKDGSSMTVVINAILDDGVVAGMMMNISDRKRTEEILELAKQDWESTFDTITDMITIHDENFNIIRSNKAAAKILGLSWLEIGRAKCYEYYHGSGCPPASCPSCVSLRTGQPSMEERYEPHLNKHLEIRAIPRIDAEGRVMGLIHVVRDISERKKAEAERAELEARLVEARRMETIGSLAGGVAHEVRNPLNAIMALTDALDREIGGNGAYHTYLQHMRTQVDRLSTLMSELLELGKPVEPEKLRREPLAEICAVSVDAWKQSKSVHGRDIVMDISGDGKDACVLADSRKLQQVFINLLDNAAQHSEEGEPIRIEVLPPAAGWVSVRVVDRGKGIPAEVLPRVFDTFFTTRRGGTGLGLSIVKHIVEKHEGVITLANNEPPPGCSVTVVLPVLKESR